MDFPLEGWPPKIMPIQPFPQFVLDFQSNLGQLFLNYWSTIAQIFFNFLSTFVEILLYYCSTIDQLFLNYFSTISKLISTLLSNIQHPTVGWLHRKSPSCHSAVNGQQKHFQPVWKAGESSGATFGQIFGENFNGRCCLGALEPFAGYYVRKHLGLS